MRLQRIGRKNDPAYRVVVVDSRQGPKSGNFVSIVGTYNPKLGQVALKGNEIKEWMKNGVQVSPTVHNMLITQKVIEGKKINVLPKNKIVAAQNAAKEAEAAKAAAAAPAPEPEVAPETPAEVAPEAPAEVTPEVTETPEAAPAEVAPEIPSETPEETPEEAPAEAKEESTN